jgi:hypothetical protein
VTDDDLSSVARDLPTDALIVVHAPRPGKPGRRVEIRHEYVGTAFGPSDVVEFARRSRLDDLDLDDSETVSWRGGDANTW